MGQGGFHLSGFVTIEKGLGPEGRIAVVRFDRGDGINALSPEALRQLTDAARSFEDDAETRWSCSPAAQERSAPASTSGIPRAGRAKPWIWARCAGT
jgi:hypothetical protein